MSRSILVFCISFIFSVYADDRRDLAEGLREHLVNTVKLDITLNQVKMLETAGFSSADIQDIIRSPEYHAFLGRILTHEKIVSQIDKQVSELLAPGYLESEIKKFQASIRENQREDLVEALRELARFQSRPAKTLQREEETFLVKLWKKFKRDIFS